MSANKSSRAELSSLNEAIIPQEEDWEEALADFVGELAVQQARNMGAIGDDPRRDLDLIIFGARYALGALKVIGPDKVNIDQTDGVYQFYIDTRDINSNNPHELLAECEPVSDDLKS